MAKDGYIYKVIHCILTLLSGLVLNMTKSDLIESLARNQGHLAHKDVELAVKSLIEKMSQSLAGGERIEIRGATPWRVGTRY